jgi:hypothetical protein
MILFILPTLFIVLLGPAALSIVDTFSGKANAGGTTQTASTSTGGGGSGGPSTVIVTERSGPASAGGGAGPNQVITRGAPVKTEETPKEARIVPASGEAKVGALFNVDVDARVLANGSQLQLVIVPADAPETPPAAEELAKHGVAISPIVSRVSIKPYAPGLSELRLYYLPPDGSQLVVAARAPLEVTGDAAGAAPPNPVGSAGGATR